MVLPGVYKSYSIISLCCSVLGLFAFGSGLYRTHFSRRLMLIRQISLLAQCIYFTALAYTPRDKFEANCSTWGILLGFFFVLNQLSFLNVCWDIFWVFLKPFRTQKYAIYVQIMPHVIAGIMACILASDQSKFVWRHGLGVCWVQSIGGSFTFNPWNSFYFFAPAFVTLMIGFITIVYIYCRLQAGKICSKKWELARLLQTEKSNKIYILVEVLVVIAGYCLYYMVIETFYVAFYLLQPNGDRSQLFMACFVLQGVWEFILYTCVNVILYVHHAMPEKKRRKSRNSRAASNTVSAISIPSSADHQDRDYESLDEKQRPMSFEYFLQTVVMQEFEFFITNAENQHRYRDCLTITAHRQDLFKRVRKSCDIDDVSFFREFNGICDIFRKSVDEQLVTGKGGASGAIFCLTRNKRFYLKKLESGEALVLKEILDGLVDIWEKRPASLINRIFGLYTVKVMDVEVWFQVMDFLFYDMPGRKPTETYDLKGSAYKREVGSNPIAGDVLKDADFRLPVLLTKNLKQELSNNMKQDTIFLADNNLMDYSLLVGILYQELDDVEEDVLSITLNTQNPFKHAIPGTTRKLTMYSFGIIDYLQKWNFKKKLESKWKFLYVGDRAKISAIPPEEYRYRFLDKILQRIFGSNSQEFLLDAHKHSRSVNIDIYDHLEAQQERTDTPQLGPRKATIQEEGEINS